MDSHRGHESSKGQGCNPEDRVKDENVLIKEESDIEIEQTEPKKQNLQAELQRVMGFDNFGSTKDKKVEGNDRIYGYNKGDARKAKAERERKRLEREGREQLKTTLYSAIDEFKEQIKQSVEARQDLVNPQILETMSVAFELLTE